MRRKDAKKAQRRGRIQKGPEAEAPQQETQTAQETSEKKKLIKVLLEDEKEEQVLEWIKGNPTLHDKMADSCSRGVQRS